MRRGRLFDAVKLLDGGFLVHAYCEHREAGAALVLLEGRAQRWSITVPVDAVDWQHSVAARAGAYDAMRRAEKADDVQPEENG